MKRASIRHCFLCKQTVQALPCRFSSNKAGTPTPSDKTDEAKLAAETSDSSSASSLNTPTDFGPDYNDAFRVRPSEGAVSTVVGDLPLSPAMNPRFFRQRNQWRLKKPRSSDTTGKQQRKLARNPFAHALGGPMRECNVTRVKLPQHFLQHFRLVSNPETKSNWWFPQNVFLEDRIATQQKSETQGQARGSSSYILQSIDLMRAMFTYGGRPAKESRGAPGSFSRYGARARALFAGYSSADRSAAENAVYRQDMPEFILKLRRDFIVDQLIYLSSQKKTSNPASTRESEEAQVGAEASSEVGVDTKKGEDETRSPTVEAADASGSDRNVVEKDRGYIVPISEMEKTANIDHCGCILIFDQDEPPDINQRYAIYDVPGKRKKIPVHSMGLILGKEHCEKFIAGCKVFQSGTMFVLAKGRTRDVQAELWRIHGMLWDFPTANARSGSGGRDGRGRPGGRHDRR